jgi:hypothetical protein
MATKNVKGVKRADGNTYLYVDQAARTKIGTATLTTTAQDLSGAVNELKSGKADLDSGGKIPAAQLPSYVDDVLEYANKASFPATGESGKIYVDLATNKTYRWSGTAYVEISESLALGETSSTAYAGNKGKANADAIAVLNGTGAGSVSKTVSDAIGALDVSSVGGSGKYISAISETDGKINAVVGTMDEVPTENSNAPVKSGGIKTAIDDSVSLKTATGNPITLTDAANANAEQLGMAIEPIQDLHGYSKPWPAGGGKNLLPMTVDGLKTLNTRGTWSGNDYTINGVTFSIQTDSGGNVTGIRANGTATGDHAVFYLLGGIKSQEFPYGGMILSGGIDTSAFIQCELSNSPYTLYAKSTGNDSIINASASEQGEKVISIFIRTLVNYALSNVIFYPMIRKGTESDSTFAPYTNICPISGLTSGEVETTDGTDTNTATISFGQTVYGGSVNFKTGEVTVTHGMADLGSLNWVYNLRLGFSSDTLTDIKTGLCALACSELSFYSKSFIWGNISNIPNYSIAKNAGNKDLYVKDTDYTDAAAFKTAMSGVQLCYELATPTTLTLTPAELELLKGNNTITANGAEISIEYYPDNAIGALAERVDDKADKEDVDAEIGDLSQTGLTGDSVAAQIAELNTNKVPIYKATVDLSSLDQNTYYPVTGTELNSAIPTPQRICVNVALNSGTKPSWSTHDQGFSVTLDVLVQGNGYGTQTPICHVLIDTSGFVSGDISPCAYSQMTNSSTPVIWCRGGGKYFIYTDYDSDWTIRTSTYTKKNQSVSPKTTKPANNIWEANGYFGGAAHYVRDIKNGKNLAIRYGGSGLISANYIPAFNTDGTEIAPMSLATLGSLLNIVGKYSSSYADFNDFPHGSIVQAYGSAAHAPGSASHYYVVFTYYIANTTTYKLQLAIENGSGNIYTRDCTNGTWEDWHLVLKQDALATKYLHYISIQRYNNDAATIDVTIPIINDTAATMTKTEILAYLDNVSHIKPIHGMYHNIYQGNFILPEPIVDFVYSYYEGSEDKRLIFYRFENDDVVVTPTNQYLRIEDRFVVQIMQNA